MNAYHYESTLKDYHADRSAYSHSQIEDLIKSPPLFYGRYIADPRLYPRKESKEFDVGTVCHECLTNPNSIEGVVAEIPYEVLNADGHRKGSAWKEWNESNPDIIKMTRTELEPVYRMVDSVRQTVPEWMWKSERHFEYSIAWQDEETGLHLRCRPDWLLFREANIIVVDFKTTRSYTPRSFASDMAEYGYHRQAAWYCDGVVELFQDDIGGFIFVAVDKTPAHETRLFELDHNAIELGRKENREALTELKYRIESNNWETRDKGEIVCLDLPDWKYRTNPWSNLT